MKISDVLEACPALAKALPNSNNTSLAGTPLTINGETGWQIGYCRYQSNGDQSAITLGDYLRDSGKLETELNVVLMGQWLTIHYYSNALPGQASPLLATFSVSRDL